MIAATIFAFACLYVFGVAVAVYAAHEEIAANAATWAEMATGEPDDPADVVIGAFVLAWPFFVATRLASLLGFAIRARAQREAPKRRGPR